MLCGIGFMFLLVGAIAGIAHALHVWWVWVALAVALILFVLAILCVIIARTRMKKPMFRATATELKKDREWLKTLGEKRSLDEIKQRIERSRYRIGARPQRARYELDIPLKIKKSFQRKTTLWITAAVVVGLMFTVGPVRKKKIYVDAKGKRKGTKKLVETGLFLTAAKFAASLLRPVLVSYVTQKFKPSSSDSRSRGKW